MLLRYCLIYISIIILRHFLYLLYLCPSLDQGLFISYLCYLFFIFIFIFIMVNRMNADTLVLLLIFQNMSYYFYMITWMRNMNYFQQLKFSLRALLSICLFFCHFQPRVACESVAYKKKSVQKTSVLECLFWLLLIMAVSRLVKGELANGNTNYDTKTKAYVPI